MQQNLLARTDSQLITAFQEGDKSAMETLVLRHKDKIFTAIHMLLRDRFRAEDIFQECFLKIIRTVQEGRYCEQGKFLPWALRVAHNLCMDYFRRSKNNIPVTLPDGQDLSVLLDETAPDAGYGMEQRQTVNSVRALIEKLPDDQREVLSLRIYGEFSFKEISTMTDVSINTALGRMRYALLNLRKMIAQQQLVLR